jgi:hypothetical protein
VGRDMQTPKDEEEKSVGLMLKKTAGVDVKS